MFYLHPKNDKTMINCFDVFFVGIKKQNWNNRD